MSAESFLAALQLADSALPIGRFAHSYGLEAFLAADAAAGEAVLAELAESVVLASGMLDGAAVARAHRAEVACDLPALLALDAQVTARKLAPAARAASSGCGSRLAALSALLTDDRLVADLAQRVRRGETDGNLAVVEGALAAALGLAEREAVLLELRGTAATLLSAAVRLGRLSALRAQAVLRLLQPVIAAAATDALADGPLRTTLPELELHALAHRRATARHFAT